MFIIIACDGIWDCVTNELCINRMADKIGGLRVNEKGEMDLCRPIEELFNENLAKTLTGGQNCGTDNMTAVMIYFQDNLKVMNKEFDSFIPKSVPMYETWKQT